MQTNIQEQKALADFMLEKLRARWPDAVLAGGAPRDWYFDKVAKDLDFFVPGKPSLEEVAEVLGEPRLEPASEEDYPEAAFTVFNLGGYTTPIQIISDESSSTQEMVESFPVSLSKAWYDGECHYDRDFLLTVNTGILFYTEGARLDNEGSLLEKTLEKCSDLVTHWAATKRRLFQHIGGCPPTALPNWHRVQREIVAMGAGALEAPLPNGVADQDEIFEGLDGI